MNPILLVMLYLAMTCPAMAGTSKQEVEELYRPVEAQTAKLMTLLPPRMDKASTVGAKEGGRCPQNINIGSAQGQQNRIQHFDTTVVINEPINIQCR
jgi:hypothetical protein